MRSGTGDARWDAELAPADATPWEATIVDEELLANLTASFKRIRFFGSNAHFKNYESNREYYTTEAVIDGVLEFPVLFVEAKWGAACATSSTRACEPQRAHCKNLTEVAVDAGHWPQLDRPRETNEAIARGLLEEAQEFWPTEFLDSSFCEEQRGRGVMHSYLSKSGPLIYASPVSYRL